MEFDKSARDDVLEFHFHKSPKITPLENGNIQVKLRASGSYEIITELLKWRETVKVISQKRLRDEYILTVENMYNSIKRRNKMTNGVIEKTEAEDIEIASKCVNDFLETAEIEIEGLKDYDFRNLYDEKFSEFILKGTERYERHEDSFYITRCINFLLYNKTLDNMRTFEEMEENYGGETINTYNTLMGREGQGFERYFNNPTKEELETIENFKKKYLTIGNFMLLPLKPADNNHSLNQIKGTYTKYRDYFDLFAYDLFHESKNNYIYGKIGSDENKFYENNLLQDYPKGERNIFCHDNVEYPYYWWKDVKEDKYRKFTTAYMKKATELIEKRADRIIEKLKKELFKEA